MRGRLILVLIPIALLAAACGGSSSNGEAGKTAAAVVADARKAATAASDVHVSGSIVSGTLPLTVDLHISKDRGGKGTLTEQGLRFDLVRVGDTAYVKGNNAFLRQVAGPSRAALLRGKWLSASATHSRFAALVPLTDMSRFFTSSLGSHGKLANDGETTYEGRKVVAIRDTTRGGTLYVAAEGTPYPVAITGSKGQGGIEFDGWNEKVAIAAPSGAIDLGTLGG